MLFHQVWQLYLEEVHSRIHPQSAEVPHNTECPTHQSSTIIISSLTFSPLRPPSPQPNHQITISTPGPNQRFSRTKMLPSSKPKRKPSAWKLTSSRQRRKNRPRLLSSRLWLKLRLKLSSKPLLPRSKLRSR